MKKTTIKKTVKFNEELTTHHTYEPCEDVQQLTWNQIALDELRVNRPLELMLVEKAKHLVWCNKKCHETCVAQFTSDGVCGEQRQ